MQIIVYLAQFLILGKVLVLSHAFCVLNEIPHYAQAVSFIESGLTILCA